MRVTTTRVGPASKLGMSAASTSEEGWKVSGVLMVETATDGEGRGKAVPGEMSVGAEASTPCCEAPGKQSFALKAVECKSASLSSSSDELLSGTQSSSRMNDTCAVGWNGP